MKEQFIIDEKHNGFDFWNHCELSREVWANKYKREGEETIQDTFKRVAKAVASKSDAPEEDEAIFFEAMAKGLWMPAGRILSGAGSGRRVTLVNCFVNRKVEDCMEDIFQANTDAALTMQQGGGMGTDFSTIRPEGAWLHRTGAIASGPLPFMRMWDSMCQTIMSAGSRRGAMMGTMHCTHPDIEKFIEAKHEQGVLTNFNVSVLITDAFMEAVRDNKEWKLYFPEKPAWYEAEELGDVPSMAFVDDKEVTQYVYKIVSARGLWEKIIKSTYEYAEPGVIFIDRVNAMNNLQHVEDIQCTNPCGEQPLPPFGACNLGAVNLARMVKNPFTPEAEFDWELLKTITSVGMVFLDGVIDLSGYPLEEQRQEQINKRRTGLGISGLADALIQLGLPYSSQEAKDFAKRMMNVIADIAYVTSARIAKHKGRAPVWKGMITKDIVELPFIKNLSADALTAIKELNSGLRNGVLLTIAPTGTTSIVYGNISSSCEPNFAFEYKRNVRQPDDSFKEHTVTSFIKDFARYCNVREEDMQSDVWESTETLSVDAHLTMQATLQEFIDASISKTINCSPDITFEEFEKVYTDAYALGCKGCTTYRPSDVRGSILSTTEEPKEEDSPSNADEVVESSSGGRITIGIAPKERPASLTGTTYKLKWPTWSSALYMTINESEGLPHEIFFNTKDSKHEEWMKALSLMITALFRLESNTDFITEELRKIASSESGGWAEGKYYDSIIAYIGDKLELHIKGVKEKPEFANGGPVNLEMHTDTAAFANSIEHVVPKVEHPEPMGEKCPECGQYAMHNLGGCLTCSDCGYSKCG